VLTEIPTKVVVDQICSTYNDLHSRAGEMYGYKNFMRIKRVFEGRGDICWIIANQAYKELS
jgi:hypothetical protein